MGHDVRGLLRWVRPERREFLVKVVEDRAEPLVEPSDQLPAAAEGDCEHRLAAGFAQDVPPEATKDPDVRLKP